jgi:uncharacterized membrane protein YqhA
MPPDIGSWVYPAPCFPALEEESFVAHILAGSRFIVGIAILGAFVSSTALFLYGILAMIRSVWDAFTGGEFGVEGADALAVEVIQLIDIFLLGTVLYLVALGLYLLFINPNLPVPPWLRVGDLDALKSMIIRVVVVLIGVTFLGAMVHRGDAANILELGVAVALVVAAYTLAIFVAKLPDRSDREPSDHL